MSVLVKSKVFLVTAVLIAGGGTVAFADNTGDSPEIGSAFTDATGAIPQEASALEDYSKNSKMTASEAASFLDKLQLAVDGGALNLEEARSEASKEGLELRGTSLRANPDFPYSRVLSNTPYVSQGQNGIYCGPASGTMIARQWGKNISMATMASYMQTDHYRMTDWNRGQFVSGLNRALKYSFYAQHNSPSVAGMNAAFQATVGHYGRPIAADMVEFRGSHLTYNNHAEPANAARGHWIVGYGYSSNGTVGIWYDPGAAYLNNHGSIGVRTSFTASNSFMQQFATANGIVY